MKHEAQIKELLISNAIHLIAQGGFEKATTKEITHSGQCCAGVKMNEIYIYRLFGSKEKLYEAAFLCLENELMHAFRNGVAAVGGFDCDVKERLCSFFLLAWRFILGDEDRCRCYVRYYYSSYFKGAVLEVHKKLFEGIVSEMAPIFRENVDAYSVLHSVFTAIFDFSVRVYNGELSDDETNRPHIFNVLYGMMAAYFKEAASVS